jgi:aerobic-type carbon monoxide dehydrogenase small subunit (CoxS/CutS family)
LNREETVKKEIASFKINGRNYEVIISPNMTLSELLRDQLDLTGTKHACEVGQCGSCTVLVDGRPTLSCSTLAVAVRGKEIMTIEGLSRGTLLHPLQRAFIDHGAIQCGFCTPGMILMAKALLDENPNPTRQEVKEGLGGNLCRCTGYVKIIDAVMAAAQTMRKGGN